MMLRVVRGGMAAGIVAIVLGLAKVHAAYGPEPYDLTESFRFAATLGYIGMLLLAAYSLGLPETPRRTPQAVAAAIGAAAAGVIGISVVQLLFGSAVLPRAVMFGSAATAVPWMVFCATASRDGRRLAGERDRLVLVGESDDTAAVQVELSGRTERPAQIDAVMTCAEARLQSDGSVPLYAAVIETGATVVVLDREAQTDQTIIDQVALLHESGVRVRTLSLFYEEWLGKLPIGELERVSLMFDIGEIHRVRYGRAKRMVDVAVSIVGLLALTMLLPVVIVGNAVANRGPLFFRQVRIGRSGRPFEMLKFRSMAAGGESSEWTGEADPRITPFGSLLRRTHLDELPQVVNILRGDLSVVGPRPEQPQYVEQLASKLPFYNLRHLVRPGLTGWAQVNGGYAASEEDALEKLQYEFWYLRHQRLAVDLRVIARTLRSVVLGDGR